MGVGRRVRGEGPLPSAMMLIREFPGKDEARTGRPFSGKTGREVERFFCGSGLPPLGEVYATSFVKEWCGPDADYTEDDFARDLPDLENEIKACAPHVVVSLGRRVTRYFLGDVDMEEVHGIPWYLPLDSPARKLFEHPGQVIVFPCYNPAAGFRSPELSAASTYDFAQLEGFLDGGIDPRILYDDPIPHPVYEELTTIEDLDVAMADASTLEISSDTEGYPWAPWSVQITTHAGHAYIVRYKRRALIARFAEWVNLCADQLHFVFHNALHDLAVYRSFGIDTTKLTYDDTMIMAYVLQLEPQGLKPLGVRWCNMKMEHYDDVMGDAATRLAQDWLLSVLENEDVAHETRCLEEFERLCNTPYRDKKGTLKPGRKLKVAPKLPKSDLHKAVERCLRSKDPRKLWGDQIIDRHVEARDRYGDIWIASLDHVPLERAIGYAGRDSDATHRVKPQLAQRLRALDLWDVYSADLGTVPLIDRMQQVGIKPDLEHFRTLGVDLADELVEIQSRLAKRLVDAGISGQLDRHAGGGAPEGDGSGRDFDPAKFNPNSTYHVGDLLFERFGVVSLKRTPGGDPSTNDKVLEALEKDAKLDGKVRTIIADIREYREIYKLKHTFVDQIPSFVHRWPHDGRIHPTFRITRVVTGRLAASDPNVLALPKHGKFAKRFREGFVARDGAYIASWDLSQIELRVLAHLSQDPVLLHAFRTGVDLHATLAERIFGVKPKDQDKSKHRLPAKAVNFGIPMGMTNIGLCLELRKNGVDVSEDDAQRWLTETMQLYKEVPNYQQGKIAEARRYGFVTDLRGRRRYIGGIRSWDDAVRSEAERFAFSTPIQAGAQEVMHEAEAWAYHNVLMPRWARGEKIEPLVQIHDDLVLEMDRELLLDVDKEMVHAMTQIPAHWLSVPIETSGDYGDNWGSMHEIADLRKAA